MTRILKNRLALSTVITTLIILVVSILLASVLTYFAINVMSTRVQEESLHITNEHIWVATGGAAVGAMSVTNTGGRDVVINKITVRGQQSPWASVFLNSTNLGDEILYDATHADFTTANTGPIVLPAGNTIGIFVVAPDSVGITDIGLTIAFTVFTSQAMYYKETNVQAAPP
jgi:hypothetical protein